jgi:hypothetical protein
MMTKDIKINVINNFKAGIKYMSTQTHDEMILTAIQWAKSLGYRVVDYNIGKEIGVDALFENQFGEKVILEIETGAGFRKLFEKPRIQEALKSPPLTILGLIVVGDRIDNLEEHGIEVGLSKELFESGNLNQRVFGVRALDFKEVIPVLLVSILGIKGSAYARLCP